jgi:hypothetical protein
MTYFCLTCTLMREDDLEAGLDPEAPRQDTLAAPCDHGLVCPQWMGPWDFRFKDEQMELAFEVEVREQERRRAKWVILNGDLMFLITWGLAVAVNEDLQTPMFSVVVPCVVGTVPRTGTFSARSHRDALLRIIPGFLNLVVITYVVSSGAPHLVPRRERARERVHVRACKRIRSFSCTRILPFRIVLFAEPGAVRQFGKVH